MFLDNNENGNNNDNNINKTELDVCQEQLRLFKDKYLYLNAEFDNYKKRIEKEKIQWMNTAQSTIVTDILPIIDDFERAFSHDYKDLPPECEQYFKGFELIKRSFEKFLNLNGIQEITDIAVFDPAKHEAIMQIDSGKHKTGEIVTVLAKGYTFKGQILRPAKVSVAK